MWKTQCFQWRNHQNCFLSSNDNKRMQSIDSTETYGTSKDLLSNKEKIKCNNIIKRYKKWLTLMML